MQIAERLQLLADDLVGLRADVAPWHFGETFNILLEAAKDDLSDDPIVQALEPARKMRDRPYVIGGAAALRSKARQVRQAVIESQTPKALRLS